MTGPVEHPKDLLAAEYALGVVEPAARAEAEGLIRRDPDFATAVEAWTDRLAPLSLDAGPVTPPDRVWALIEARISPPSQRPLPTPANDFWNNAGLWRGIAAASVVAAVASLGIGLLPRIAPDSPAPIVVAPQPSAPLVALVSDPKGGRALAVVAIDTDLKRILVTPIALAQAQDRSLELWVIPAGGTPRSLGLIEATSNTRLGNRVLPVSAKGAVVAISLEPRGGSTTGAPTGPVLGVGPLVAS
jgi:anti-sigma-K factor RskA